jgi:predicted metal-dependent hydrolase
MQKKIVYQGQAVYYNIRRSERAKRLRIAVYCGGAVTVTAPYTLDESKIQAFVRLKVEWLVQKVGLLGDIKNPDLRETSRLHYLSHKKAALHLVRDKIAFWNERYGFSYNEIKIKNHKTKWGSCSVKGNLNFNYKIVFLPEDLQDYIIVHELCHLNEMNHSEAFWQLIEKSLPNYKQVKKKFLDL